LLKLEKTTTTTTTTTTNKQTSKKTQQKTSNNNEHLSVGAWIGYSVFVLFLLARRKP